MQEPFDGLNALAIRKEPGANRASGTAEIKFVPVGRGYSALTRPVEELNKACRKIRQVLQFPGAVRQHFGAKLSDVLLGHQQQIRLVGETTKWARQFT